MTREEFHRVYSQAPEHFKAELIEGTVHLPSPLTLNHGTRHSLLDMLFGVYVSGTPGVQVGNNTTVLLGEEGEPQPDVFLRLLPEFGGQSRTTADGYVDGAPELIAEVAYSSRAVDLHGKRRDYARYGVCEYLVALLKEEVIRLLDLRTGEELQPGDDGVLRSGMFPGLWIDTAAVLANDYATALSTLQRGLATPEHQAFVQRLSAAGR